MNKNSACISPDQVTCGRAYGVDLGPVNVVRFAKAFEAQALGIETPDKISSRMKKALEMQRPRGCGILDDYCCIPVLD
jgi:thiamine pyrophosphate-dependent acetolactate synthase large subunit-like protein